MWTELENRLKRIDSADEEIMKRSRERLDDLTKPQGSLGLLETEIARLSGALRKVVPEIRRPAAVIYAADHGVTMENISAYGPEVTEEMVVNMCMGSAVSSVIARNQGVKLTVVDVGVRSVVRHPSAVDRKVANGTRNFAQGPAMTMNELRAAIQVGIDIAERLIDEGHDLLVIGEMGIGNTSAATALASCLLSKPVSELVGLGTGVSPKQMAHKQKVIERAIERNCPTNDQPLELMAKLGGLEIAALAGTMIASASRHVPVLLDGLITDVAALWATTLHGAIPHYLFASHVSAEPASHAILDALGLRPMLDLKLRLGEGSGGLLALPILQNACQVMAETATFTDARVTNPHRKPKADRGQDAESVGFGTDETWTESRYPRDEGGVMASPPVALDFSAAEKEAVYKAILGRRDIRVFLPDPVPEDVLSRILLAGHHGPSVGYMQPWNFIVIEDRPTLKRLQEVVERERIAAAENYRDSKRDYYLRLKVEGLMQAPLTLCVTNDSTRGGSAVLGRNTNPETDLMSTACAIENMWLAARAEGVAMGWVSIYRKEDLRRILDVPDHVDPVALLTVGYTPHFPDIPVLERVGWGRRRPIDSVIYYNAWEQTKARDDG